MPYFLICDNVTDMSLYISNFQAIAVPGVESYNDQKMLSLAPVDLANQHICLI